MGREAISVEAADWWRGFTCPHWSLKMGWSYKSFKNSLLECLGQSTHQPPLARDGIADLPVIVCHRDFILFSSWYHRFLNFMDDIVISSCFYRDIIVFNLREWHRDIILFLSWYHRDIILFLSWYRFFFTVVHWLTRTHIPSRWLKGFGRQSQQQIR